MAKSLKTKYVHRVYAGLLLVLWLQQAPAQIATEPGKYPADYNEDYIEDYRHRLNFSFVTEAKANGIGILTPENKLVTYQTNLAIPQYGFMATYRWLNVQLTLPIPGLSYVPKNRGNTDALALSLGITGRHVVARAFYERFTGYFMSNPQVLIPTLLPDQKLLFSGMTSHTYYSTMYYIANGAKYAHRGLLWQSEVQKKSAGSFLMGLTGGIKNIASPTDILPDPIPTDVNEVRFAVVGLTAGYAYTLVMGKHFSTSLAILPGLNYIWGSYAEFGKEEVFFNQNFGVNAEMRWQLLYQRNNGYAGISFTTYVLSDLNDQEYPVGSAHNYLKINVGYRFKVKPIAFLKPFNLSN